VTFLEVLLDYEYLKLPEVQSEWNKNKKVSMHKKCINEMFIKLKCIWDGLIHHIVFPLINRVTFEWNVFHILNFSLTKKMQKNTCNESVQGNDST
jgi:hypothetical protein